MKHLELRYPGLREQPRGPADATTGLPLAQVDVLALSKASQAVSSELDLGKLIETLLVIALECVGANALLSFFSEATSRESKRKQSPVAMEFTVSFRQVFPTPAELPDSILRYVIRTQENIILDDASVPNQFSGDEYVRNKQARSVLCLPLVKQASLKGALYLKTT